MMTSRWSMELHCDIQRSTLDGGLQDVRVRSATGSSRRGAVVILMPFSLFCPGFPWYSLLYSPLLLPSFVSSAC